MLNILWILLPIIGWFALGGYIITIIKHYIKGDFKELPKFNFGRDANLGFFMFFKAIPFMFAYMIVQSVLSFVPVVGLIVTFLISLFVVPILTMNFFNKETVGSYFEFSKVSAVFENFREYIIVVLKSIALQVIFLLMIIVLVGIPAGQFTKNIFFADFYGRFAK
jgi:hypothetical protein